MAVCVFAMHCVLLVALAVELFQLVIEVVDDLLVTLLETRLGRLVLDHDQLQVLLQLLHLVLSSPTDLALQRTSPTTTSPSTRQTPTVLTSVSVFSISHFISSSSSTPNVL